MGIEADISKPCQGTFDKLGEAAAYSASVVTLLKKKSKWGNLPEMSGHVFMLREFLLRRLYHITLIFE